MSRKPFDILPPFRPTKKNTASPPSRKRKNNPGVFIVILLLAVFMVIFIQSANNTKPINISVPTTKPAQHNPESQSSFELFDQNNQPNPSDQISTTQKIIKVRILNASNRIDEIEKVKALFDPKIFTIEQSTTAENTYDQTIIYYRKGQLEQANKVNDILKGKYSTKLQESENLKNTFDILLIIGKR